MEHTAKPLILRTFLPFRVASVISTSNWACSMPTRPGLEDAAPSVIVAGTASSLGSSTYMGSTPATVVAGGFVDEEAASSWSAAEVAAASAASFIAFSSSSFRKIASKRSRHSFE